MLAEELRPDGKILTDIINSTDNFEQLNLDNSSCWEVQHYIKNLGLIKDLKNNNAISNDIYEYISKHLPVIEN